MSAAKKHSLHQIYMHMYIHCVSTTYWYILCCNNYNIAILHSDLVCSGSIGLQISVSGSG